MKHNYDIKCWNFDLKVTKLQLSDMKSNIYLRFMRWKVKIKSNLWLHMHNFDFYVIITTLSHKWLVWHSFIFLWCYYDLPKQIYLVWRKRASIPKRVCVCVCIHLCIVCVCLFVHCVCCCSLPSSLLFTHMHDSSVCVCVRERASVIELFLTQIKAEHTHTHSLI